MKCCHHKALTNFSHNFYVRVSARNWFKLMTEYEYEYYFACLVAHLKWYENRINSMTSNIDYTNYSNGLLLATLKPFNDTNSCLPPQAKPWYNTYYSCNILRMHRGHARDCSHCTKCFCCRSMLPSVPNQSDRQLLPRKKNKLFYIEFVKWACENKCVHYICAN